MWAKTRMVALRVAQAQDGQIKAMARRTVSPRILTVSSIGHDPRQPEAPGTGVDRQLFFERRPRFLSCSFKFSNTFLIGVVFNGNLDDRAWRVIGQFET
jgi:hypothetical protein